MKKSELIEKLQKEVAALGDDYLLSYKIIDSGGAQSFTLLSPNRTNKKTGSKAGMSFKEFRDYVLEKRWAQE